MRLSRRGIESIRRGLIRSWRDGTHRQRQQSREIDADTMRKRALHDRRGSLYARITLPTECGERTFTLRWSTAGRTDQVDAFGETGALVLTKRPGAMLEELAPPPALAGRKVACVLVGAGKQGRQSTQP